MKNPTTVERKSDRELVVTRTFDAPARIVFPGVEQAGAVQALVAAEVDGNDAGFLRSGYSHRRQLPARDQPSGLAAHGVLRQVSRSDPCTRGWSGRMTKVLTVL